MGEHTARRITLKPDCTEQAMIALINWVFAPGKQLKEGAVAGQFQPLP